MSERSLTVLGTASLVPTRCRNHHGAYLRWDDAGLIFDPGEGTQRQMTLYGVRAHGVHHLLLTHFHGDHCLGVPGVVQRLSFDRVSHPVHAWFPASGQVYFDRLRRASIFEEFTKIVEHPLRAEGEVGQAPGFSLFARRLDHRVEAFGYRLQEPDGVRMVPEKLAQAGLRGPLVGRLIQIGEVTAPSGQRVRLAEVSEPKPGQSFAFIMDTRLCDAAIELARGVDLLVAESTFLRTESHEAQAYGHMTAEQAATLAREAGARKLVLTHFSQRYPDERAFLEEATPIFSEVVAARDGDVIPVPPRRPH
ncbi:MAG: ribonuclease Z [Deltaproteobacteria bacterium]|nr:MAG: ribonuclease Z [Deltaproteobacteria bacterium]